jgi:hypothetical protein
MEAFHPFIGSERANAILDWYLAQGANVMRAWAGAVVLLEPSSPIASAHDAAPFNGEGRSGYSGFTCRVLPETVPRGVK